ncbi:hypothetical protein CAMGR0001_2835 [Campylobacter gracilis RM3268]|uniref:Uncharacterized protein n=1 Tax=Campylobacter gracilis RM3268 TaxID=553220 RepID=C8PL45_9BACT|nr:hypothetical protein CAMGR0001_2835 [Campylobacter gracilis RM3268]
MSKACLCEDCARSVAAEAGNLIKSAQGNLAKTPGQNLTDF